MDRLRPAALAAPVLSLLLALHGANGQALTLTVRDQHGQPLADAVVAVPGVAAETPTDPAIMDQVSKRFQPHVLVAQRDQLVDFPNSDDIRHHVYSFSGDNSFEIRLYSGTPSAPRQFRSPGIVVLGCNIHDSMIGYIFVADGMLARKSNAAGEVELPDAAREGVLAWHPRLQAGINQLLALTPENDALVLALTPPPKPKSTTFKSRFRPDEN